MTTQAILNFVESETIGTVVAVDTATGNRHGYECRDRTSPRDW
jgi:hypothetical protein